MHILDDHESSLAGEAGKFVIESCAHEENQILNHPNQVEKRGIMFDESNTKCSLEIKNGMTSRKLNVNQTNKLVLHDYSVSTVHYISRRVCLTCPTLFSCERFS